MSKQLIPVVSLFSGAGGMDLGFRRQGFVPILALDASKSAVETYNLNTKKEIARQCDLSQLSDAEILSLVQTAAAGTIPRGVIGGPPCQGFSVSNVHKKKRDPRNELPLRYAQILKLLNQEYQLDFFVFENVAGLKSKHRKKFNKIRDAFEDAGFNVFVKELDASMHGVAQHRRRIFVVGINKRVYPNFEFEFPQGDSRRPITVKNAIGGLPDPTYFQHGLKSQDIPNHPNHWTMNPRSPKFKKKSIQTGRSFRKLTWHQPSWTVAYGNREIHIHPNGKRRLSIYEAMLLQGFPKSYELRGNFSQQVTLVSDAVPPPLASAIAKTIKKLLYKRVENIQTNLLNWFKKNRRIFPWRETKDPYKILLAEKLLQQTAATEKVVTAYKEIIKRYPTLETLANADVEALKRIIAPLGFLYRAQELPKLAQAILSHDHDTFPDELSMLTALPGVGDYSARAVLAFAFDHDVSIVDTNVARLLHRLCGITEPIPNNPARSKKLIDIAQALVPKGKARAFNLAILDSCFLICKPRNPKCSQCPLVSFCVYGSSKNVPA